MLDRTERRIVNNLGLNPETPGLIINPSRDDQWLTAYTTAGKPAEWVAEWTERTVDAHGEAIVDEMYQYGTFDQLPAAVNAILANPALAPDSMVEFEYSEWAAHYSGRAA